MALMRTALVGGAVVGLIAISLYFWRATVPSAVDAAAAFDDTHDPQPSERSATPNDRRRVEEIAQQHPAGRPEPAQLEVGSSEPPAEPSAKGRADDEPVGARHVPSADLVGIEGLLQRLLGPGSPSERRAAAAALARHAALDDAAIDRILQAAGAPSLADRESANAALLAAGAMLGRDDLSEPVRERVRQALAEQLHGAAGDTARTAVALEALGNTGDRSQEPFILPMVDHPGHVEKAAAIAALAAIGAPLPVNQVLSQLAGETSADVQGALLSHLAQPGAAAGAQPSAVALATRLLVSPTQPNNVKQAALRLLQSLASRYPEAGKALRERAAARVSD